MPKTREAEEGMIAEGAQAPSLEADLPRKILIVEDNKIARMVLQSELTDLSLEFLIAEDGEMALALAEKEKPAAITMQLDLPKLGGIEVCRRLKKNRSTRDIPVLFVTQRGTPDQQREAFGAGAVDFLVTPFSRGKLAGRIQRLLEVKHVTTPQTILVAEDSETIRAIIAGILKRQGHTVVEARDGMEAWNCLQARKDIDILVSDINMPNMDGHQLCRMVRGSEEHAFMPILIVSTMADKEDIAMLLNAGADDYIIKPFAAEEFLARLKAHIRVRHLYYELSMANSRLKTFNESLEKMVEFRTSELHEANMEALTMLAVASEYRDTDTGNHVRRIAAYTRHLALAMNYSESRAEEISYSSILHDVGKIAISDAILKKPGKLTDEEFNLMKGHAVHGEAILKSNSGFFKMGREVARWHHERFDGSGYPDGLEGYNIPLAARITAVADVFDALMNKRVYKEAWPIEKAMEFIVEGSGRHFDPLVVDAFEKIFKDGTIQKICGQYL